jgi:hypothetical protein
MNLRLRLLNSTANVCNVYITEFGGGGLYGLPPLYPAMRVLNLKEGHSELNVFVFGQK